MNESPHKHDMESNLVHARLDTHFLLAATINYQQKYQYKKTNSAFQKSLSKFNFVKGKKLTLLAGNYGAESDDKLYNEL